MGSPSRSHHKTGVEPEVVTREELTALASWEDLLAASRDAAANAEKECKARRLVLACKVLGIEKEEELRRMCPEELGERLTDRLAKKLWRSERGAPIFEFVKTAQGSYPAWRKLFENELGESAAAKIAADTPVTYSYRVEVQK